MKNNSSYQCRSSDSKDKISSPSTKLESVTIALILEKTFSEAMYASVKLLPDKQQRQPQYRTAKDEASLLTSTTDDRNLSIYSLRTRKTAAVTLNGQIIMIESATSDVTIPKMQEEFKGSQQSHTYASLSS